MKTITNTNATATITNNKNLPSNDDSGVEDNSPSESSKGFHTLFNKYPHQAKNEIRWELENPDERQSPRDQVGEEGE